MTQEKSTKNNTKPSSNRLDHAKLEKSGAVNSSKDNFGTIVINALKRGTSKNK